MISAPAAAARSASGTPETMCMTSEPLAWARSKYERRSWSLHGQAVEMTFGRASTLAAKRSSSTENSR
jgi:hypothetical protein